MTKNHPECHQIDTPNNFFPAPVKEDTPDGLGWWADNYFKHAVTTSELSRKEQRRDINLFIKYMILVEKTDARFRWTPRLSEAFKEQMRAAIKENGLRHWSDRFVNRVLAHLKTFAKWVNVYRPFPLGNPMLKIRAVPVANSLEIERALTPGERRQILDAADYLTENGGRSKSRQRYVRKERPVRKGYRPWRNRAIIYTLVGTGMRRKAVTQIFLADVDFEKKSITVEEKGGTRHKYQINKEGLTAIQDYLEKERGADHEKWKSPALFLSARTNAKGYGQLTSQVINDIWDDVCKVAGVQGRTPHSARHAMGRHIMEKSNGNVSAVQRQLGHKNACYSLQYSRITGDELNAILDEL